MFFKCLEFTVVFLNCKRTENCLHTKCSIIHAAEQWLRCIYCNKLLNTVNHNNNKTANSLLASSKQTTKSLLVFVVLVFEFSNFEVET